MQAKPSGIRPPEQGHKTMTPRSGRAAVFHIGGGRLSKAAWQGLAPQCEKRLYAVLDANRGRTSAPTIEGFSNLPYLREPDGAPSVALEKNQLRGTTDNAANVDSPHDKSSNLARAEFKVGRHEVHADIRRFARD
jgi:hypothetical protein